MRPDELAALGELAGDAASAVSAHVRDLHQGIAQRVWSSVGPVAAPVRFTHDRIAAGVYTSLERSLGPVLRGSSRALSLTQKRDARSIEESHAARIALGALNGLFGDKLEQRGNALAIRMSLRHGGLGRSLGGTLPAGRELSTDRAELARAYPEASGRLALFLHGLCETEDAWRLGTDRHPPYGERLRAELGYTPLYVRYNSGRHISENGRELGSLLERITAAWPVEVQEIALVGHSMGGLVARSACHYHADSDWASKVRHVFMLGSPHRGAPLETVALAVCAAMSRLPETRSLANALNARSAGIKDLGCGYLVDEDWREHDPQAFLARTGREVPFLRTANHYFMSASLDQPLGRVVGDLLVLRSSAWAHGGRGERLRFPVEQYAHASGVNHIDMLNHAAVYGQIHKWLTGRPALPRPVAQLPAGPQG